MIDQELIPISLFICATCAMIALFIAIGRNIP